MRQGEEVGRRNAEVGKRTEGGKVESNAEVGMRKLEGLSA